MSEVNNPTSNAKTGTPLPNAHDVAVARGRVIEAKLGGYQELARILPDTTDQTQLNDSADKLAAKLGILPAVTTRPVDPASLNPYDRMLHAVGQQTPSSGNRLATPVARAVSYVTSEKLGDVSHLSAYERLGRIVALQEKQLGR